MFEVCVFMGDNVHVYKYENRRKEKDIIFEKLINEGRQDKNKIRKKNKEWKIQKRDQ